MMWNGVYNDEQAYNEEWGLWWETGFITTNRAYDRKQGLSYEIKFAISGSRSLWEPGVVGAR